MRFLSDECTRRSTIRLLRSLGQEVTTVLEAGLGSKQDPEIFDWAKSHESILITEDTDFLNMDRYPPHQGVVVLRITQINLVQTHEVLIKLMRELTPDQFRGSLIVVDQWQYRIRRL